MQAAFDVWRFIGASAVPGDPIIGIGVIDSASLRPSRGSVGGATGASPRAKLPDLPSVIDAMGNASAKVQILLAYRVFCCSGGKHCDCIRLLTGNRINRQLQHRSRRMCQSFRPDCGMIFRFSDATELSPMIV